MADTPASPFDILKSSNGQDNVDTATVPEATEEEQKLVGEIEDFFLRADQERQAFANEWGYYEQALFAGDRGVQLRENGYNGDLIQVTNLNKKDLTVKNNRLIVVYNAWLGKMTRNQPKRSVSPVSGSLDEMIGCRAADRLLDLATEATKLNLKLDDCKADIPWGSNGYLELSWDPKAGGPIGQCHQCGFEDPKLTNSEPCPHCELQMQAWQQLEQQYQQVHQMPGPSGQPPTAPLQPGQQPSDSQHPGMPQPPPLPPQPPQPAPMAVGYRGGPRIDHHDPRTVYLQPGIDRKENLEAYIIRVPMSVTAIREMFPESAALVHSEPVYPANGSLYSVDARTGTMSGTRMQNQAFLFKYNERPSTAFPRGRVVYMCNSRILRQTENPYYRFRRFPLFVFGWLRIPGTLYSLPPIANAYQLQEQLNQVETNIYQYMVMVNTPKFVNPQGSGISPDEVTAATAQVISPRRGFAEKLYYLMPPPMPAENYQRPSTLKDDMQSVMAVTNQELAQTPNDANGRYAAMAQSASDQSIGHILRHHYDEEADIARCMLILYQDNMPKDDTFSVFNEDFLETYSFADLDLNPYNLAVTLDANDGLSSNDAVRMDQISNLVQLGLFGQPGTPGFDFPLFAKASKLKILGMVPDKKDISIQNANAIIHMLDNGEQWEPQPEDDANLFLGVFTQWLQVNGRRKNATFKNPQIIEKVRQVAAYYQNILFQAQMQQQQQMAEPPPPGPGGPSTAGAKQSAPGGTPNSAAGVDPNQSQVSAQGADLVRGADKAADGAVKAGMPHES